MVAFDITIVGGGLVGLGASVGLARQGHRVRVLEASPSLQVVGDAIASTANHTRVLDRWGLLDGFLKVAPRDLGVMQHRRYATAEVISKRDMDHLSSSYGYPSYILSRKAYQQFLYDRAIKLGVDVHFNSRVERVDDNERRPVISVVDGRNFESDIVVGCDGVRSAIRAQLFPDIQCVSHKNCYRAVLAGDNVAAHPEISEFTKSMNFWMGPDRLVIQSVMADIGAVAVNLYHPGDSGTAGSWKQTGDVQRMRETFSDFDASLQKLLSLVDECISWKVVEVPSLPSWVSPRGRVILIGDAAHAMVPYAGQGCAMGMEDAAALAECITRARSEDDLPQLLRFCESIRRPRVELISRSAATIGKIWQMPDGPAQEQRDEKMRSTPLYSTEGWDGEPIDSLPSSLQDPLYQPWVLSHDAASYASRRLDQDMHLAEGGVS